MIRREEEDEIKNQEKRQRFYRIKNNNNDDLEKDNAFIEFCQHSLNLEHASTILLYKRRSGTEQFINNDNNPLIIKDDKLLGAKLLYKIRNKYIIIKKHPKKT